MNRGWIRILVLGLAVNLFGVIVFGAFDAFREVAAVCFCTLVVSVERVDVVHTTDLTVKGEVFTLPGEAGTVDLSKFAEGVFAALGIGIPELPGFITQIRVVVSDAVASIDGSFVPVFVPGGVIRLDGVLVVPDEAVAEIDLEKSVIATGRGTFILSPVFPFQGVRFGVGQLGDRDGFGFGLTEGDIRATSPSPFFDNREADDPLFTDVYPIPPVEFPVDSFSFTQSFTLPAGTITGAELRLFTIGIQDGDTQVVGSDTDVRLFLDESEVPDAFDLVDQFDFFSGVGFAEIAGMVTIEIPAGLLTLLSDGVAVIRIEVHQLGPAESIDAFAIDFSELLVISDG